MARVAVSPRISRIPSRGYPPTPSRFGVSGAPGGLTLPQGSSPPKLMGDLAVPGALMTAHALRAAKYGDELAGRIEQGYDSTFGVGEGSKLDEWIRKGQDYKFEMINPMAVWEHGWDAFTDPNLRMDSDLGTFLDGLAVGTTGTAANLAGGIDASAAMIDALIHGQPVQPAAVDAFNTTYNDWARAPRTPAGQLAAESELVQGELGHGFAYDQGAATTDLVADWMRRLGYSDDEANEAAAQLGGAVVFGLEGFPFTSRARFPKQVKAVGKAGRGVAKGAKAIARALRNPPPRPTYGLPAGVRNTLDWQKAAGLGAL